MTAYQAEQLFDDAKNHLDPERDPVRWNLMNGLSALAQELRNMSSTLSRLDREIQQLQADVRTLKTR